MFVESAHESVQLKNPVKHTECNTNIEVHIQYAV